MKIIGSAFIIVASITVSFFYEKKQKENLMLLKSICSFLEYIKNQIEFFSLPLNVIFEQSSNKTCLINELIVGKEIDVFSQEINDEINICFSGLGKSYKSEQIKKLDYTIMFLKEQINKTQENYSEKIKVFRAIAIFVGCSMVILLV